MQNVRAVVRSMDCCWLVWVCICVSDPTSFKYVWFASEFFWQYSSYQEPTKLAPGSGHSVTLRSVKSAKDLKSAEQCFLNTEATAQGNGSSDMEELLWSAPSMSVVSTDCCAAGGSLQDVHFLFQKLTSRCPHRPNSVTLLACTEGHLVQRSPCYNSSLLSRSICGGSPWTHYTINPFVLRDAVTMGYLRRWKSTPSRVTWSAHPTEKQCFCERPEILALC